MHQKCTTRHEQESQWRPGRRAARMRRVSGEDQEDWGYGLDIQEDDIRRFAASHDWDLHDDYDYSGDESGRIPLHQRPIYQRALADARAGRFDVMTFGCINRIARRAYLGMQLIDELKHAGMRVITADLLVDTDEPEGQYVPNIMLCTAEFDASSIIKNTGKGRAKRLATKKPWVSKRHYGYRYVKPNHAEKISGGMEKHEEEARTIYADAAGKRELLDAVQLRVYVAGEQWWAEGIVPGLRLEGRIAPSRWDHEENAWRSVTLPLRSSASGPA